MLKELYEWYLKNMDTIPVQVAEQIVAELVESEHDRYVRPDLIAGGIVETIPNPLHDHDFNDQWFEDRYSQPSSPWYAPLASILYTGYVTVIRANKRIMSEENQETAYRLFRLRHLAGK